MDSMISTNVSGIGTQLVGVVQLTLSYISVAKSNEDECLFERDRCHFESRLDLENMVNSKVLKMVKGVPNGRITFLRPTLGLSVREQTFWR